MSGVREVAAESPQMNVETVPRESIEGQGLTLDRLHRVVLDAEREAAWRGASSRDGDVIRSFWEGQGVGRRECMERVRVNIDALLGQALIVLERLDKEIALAPRLGAARREGMHAALAEAARGLAAASTFMEREDERVCES